MAWRTFYSISYPDVRALGPNGVCQERGLSSGIIRISCPFYSILHHGCWYWYFLMIFFRYVLVAIWLSSFTFTSLPLFFVMEYKENKSVKLCSFSWAAWMQVAYVGTLATLWYLLPLAVISCTYIYITTLLRRSSTFHKHTLKTFDRYSSSMRKRMTTEVRRLKENKRARKILTPLILVFAITMLPLNALRLIASLWPEVTRWEYFLAVYNLCVIGVVVNSASNPVIYSIVTNGFCRCPCRLLKWLECCNNENTRSKLLKRKENYIQNLRLQDIQHK